MKEMKYQIEPKKAEILEDNEYKGYHYLIVSYGTHPAGYIEIDYNKSLEKLSIHGGITYNGNLKRIKENYINNFIGWDYAHYGDYLGFYEIIDLKPREQLKKWSTKEILKEIKIIIDEIEKGTLNNEKHN